MRKSHPGDKSRLLNQLCNDDLSRMVRVSDPREVKRYWIMLLISNVDPLIPQTPCTAPGGRLAPLKLAGTSSSQKWPTSTCPANSSQRLSGLSSGPSTVRFVSDSCNLYFPFILLLNHNYRFESMKSLVIVHLLPSVWLAVILVNKVLKHYLGSKSFQRP